MQRTKTRSSARQVQNPGTLKVLPSQSFESRASFKQFNSYGQSITNCVVSVTPELARKWLDTNIQNNRRVIMGKVDKWAKVMQEGKWRLGDPILFDKDGRLFQGQHRLHAVIKSGATVDFVVIHGYDEECAQVVDLGVNRRLHDVARLQGKKTGPAEAAIMRSMIIPCSKYYKQKDLISHSAMLEVIDEYLPYIEYAMKVAPHRNHLLNKASFLAAIARAAYFYNVINNADTEVAQRLNEARVILKTGMTADENDTALLRLRDWLISGKGITNTSSNRILVHNVSDYYLWLFMNRKPRKNISLPDNYETKMLVPALDIMFG